MSEKASKVAADLAEQQQRDTNEPSRGVQLSGGVQSGFVSTGSVDIGGHASFGNTTVTSGEPSQQPVSANEKKSENRAAAQPNVTASELELLKKLKRTLALGHKISDNDAGSYYDVLDKYGIGFQSANSEWALYSTNGQALSQSEAINVLSQLLKQLGDTDSATPTTPNTSPKGVSVGGNVSQGFVSTSTTHIDGNANFGNTTTTVVKPPSKKSGCVIS